MMGADAGFLDAETPTQPSTSCGRRSRPTGRLTSVATRFLPTEVMP